MATTPPRGTIQPQPFGPEYPFDEATNRKLSDLWHSYHQHASELAVVLENLRCSRDRFFGGGRAYRDIPLDRPADPTPNPPADAIHHRLNELHEEGALIGNLIGALSEEVKGFDQQLLGPSTNDAPKPTMGGRS